MSSSLTPSTRYTLTAIVLHWLLGAALLGMIGVGWYMADLPFSPLRLKLYNWHKWAGITILVLSAARLLWRLTHRPPALPVAIEDAMPRWQQWGYHATHYALYALFFVVPLLGWAYSSAAGFPIVVFGVLPLPDLLTADRALAEAIKPLHGYAAFLLLALIVAHVGAAIKHHFIDRDGLISRMLPSKERP
jgi:cytochrome b561